MVTPTLAELLTQKEWYSAEYPDGANSMPPRVLQSYHNLLAEIRQAGVRAQGQLPGLEAVPAAESDQLAMF